MKTIILIIAAFLASTSISSQSLEWAFNVGGSFGDLATDSYGNVLMVGTFSGSIDIDPGPNSLILNASVTNGFVAKYSPAGALLWGFSLGTDSRSFRINIVRTDNHDNVYIGGQFSVADFDPSPDTFLMTSPVMESVFIAKYSPSGQLIHAVSFADGGNLISNRQTLRDFRIDSLGNIYCTGLLTNYPMDFDPSEDSLILQSPSANPNIFIAKYTKDLSLVWAKRIGPKGISGYQFTLNLALDNAGMFYIGGLFAQDSVDFDPSPSSSFYLKPSHMPYDVKEAFLAKYDTAGAFQWVRKMESPIYSTSWNLVSCSNGDILTSGFFTKSIDLTPLAATPTILHSADTGYYKANSFIARLNAGGDLLWGRAMAGSDHVYHYATEDVSGNIVVAGNFYDTLFPYGINQHPYIVSKGTNMYIATYSPAGQLLCIQTVGDDSSWFDVGVVYANQGSILVGGRFGGNVDFDPGTGTHFLNAATGQAFLAKYTLNTGIEKFSIRNTGYLVFPNPTTDYLSIQTKDNSPLPQGKLQIFNMQGALQMEHAIPKYQHQLQLNLSHLPAGLYLGRIISSSGEGGGFRFVKE